MDDVTFDSIQLWGAEMTAMPQVKLRKLAAVSDATPSETEPAKKTAKAAPVKPIKARFEPKKVDIVLSQL